MTNFKKLEGFPFKKKNNMDGKNVDMAHFAVSVTFFGSSPSHGVFAV